MVYEMLTVLPSDSQKSFKMASTSSVIVAEKNIFDVFWASYKIATVGPEP
jgi:hypothetical protein